MNSQKQTALDSVAEEIKNCPLCKIGTSGVPVPGEGSPQARIMFIGEAPGKTEAKSGHPFTGRSGKLLRLLIQSIGLKEKDVFITSPVKYLPDQGTPSLIQIRHGMTHLTKQLDSIKPVLVVLMGSVAVQGVLEQKTQVLKEHGRVIVKDNRKYFLTLHPAAAMRFPRLKKIFQQDFEKLKEYLTL